MPLSLVHFVYSAVAHGQRRLWNNYLYMSSVSWEGKSTFGKERRYTDEDRIKMELKNNYIEDFSTRWYYIKIYMAK